MPFFRNVRALGMGGASVAVVNDENSLFLNPAGLGRIRGPYWVVANPEIELNVPLNNAVAPSYEYMKIHNDPDYLMTKALASPDTHLHARYQAASTFVTTNFGFGVFSKYTWDVEYNSSTSKYRVDHTNDWGAALGYCLRLFDGRIKIGATGKVLNRVSIAQDLPSNTTNRSMGSLVTEGGGVGLDAGILLTGPWVFLPTLGVTVHDVGDTKLNATEGYFYKPSTRPDAIKQKTNAAFAISPIVTNSLRYTITGEYHDIQNPDQTDMYRRIHAGMEINVNDILFLRGGLNQRYYTAGLELNLGSIQLQFATYGEEIGTATANKEDRRYVAQFAFRL